MTLVVKTNRKRRLRRLAVKLSVINNQIKGSMNYISLNVINIQLSSMDTIINIELALADEVSTKNTLKELTRTKIVKQSAPL